MLEDNKNKEPRSTHFNEDLFFENEVKTNVLGQHILFGSGLLLLLILILNYYGIFPLQFETIVGPCLQGIIEIFFIIVISRIFKNQSWWIKYLILTGLVFVYARLDMMLTHKTAILMVIPVMFSSRYFTEKLTFYTIFISIVSFFLSSYYGAEYGMIDLNIVTMEPGVTFTATGGFLGDAILNTNPSLEMLRNNTILYNFVPKMMMFMITSYISYDLATTGREMVISQFEKDKSTQAIKTELNLANRIQLSTLPSVFPPFPDRDEFEIYATMTPAKEVGGDFYDFYFIDNDHLAITMADVSGKGIPAALFMMVSKLMIQNMVSSGFNPAEVLHRVNDSICKRSHEEMFITVWLAVIDLKTGKVVASNAGHEYPIIMKKDGDYEVLKDKHGFVVGGMIGTKYTDYEFTLEPGDKLFVYTDGLPEATNKFDELFGLKRTVESLNVLKDKNPEHAFTYLKKSVDKFVGEAEQFDDLTMLCFELKHTSK